MSPLDISYVFLVSFLFLLTFLLYFHDRRSKVNRRYFLFLVFTLYFVCISVGTKIRAIPAHFFVLHMIASTYIGFLFYLFTRVVVNPRDKFKKTDYIWVVAGLYGLGYNVYLIVPDGAYEDLKRGIYFTDISFYRAYTKHFTYKIFLVVYISGFVMGITHLVKNLRGMVDPLRRRQVILVLAGTLVGLLIFIISGNVLPAMGHFRYANFSLFGLVIGFSIVGFSIVTNKSWKLEKKLDEDRLRISQELHDMVGSELSGVLFLLAEEEKKNPLVQKVSANIRKSLDNLRDLVYVLNEPEKIDEELEGHMYRLIDRMRRLNRFSIDDKIEEIGTEIGVFKSVQVLRIFTEVFTNILRHSKAKHVCVRWRRVNERVSLTVKDDGQGLDQQRYLAFNQRNISAIKSLGLRNILNRTEKIKARCRFFKPGRGLIFQLMISS